MPISSGLKINRAEATNICEIATEIKINNTASDGVILDIQVNVKRPAEIPDKESPTIMGTTLGIPLISSTPCFLNPILYDGKLNSWNAVTTNVAELIEGEKRTFPLSDDVLWIDVGESYDTESFQIKNIIKTVYIHPEVTVKEQTITKLIPIPKSTTPKKYWVNVGIADKRIIKDSYYYPNPKEFIIPSDDSKINPTGRIERETSTNQIENFNFQCVPPYINQPGCYAAFFYLIWWSVSPITEVAAHFLDFFVYYSTNSTSYSNEFVSQGWGAVRDVANIFFIIVLLYIAIKMVLSLDDHGSKKLIGSVIVVALVINFSLFATKVVIDSSNILAKVFYNSMISVDAKNPKKTIEAGSGGERSLSIGLVQKFNPQKLLKQDVYDANKKMFIVITLLLIIITLYTAYIFFSVALLFVARVVSLWLSMIFSPIAFLSFATPFDLSGLGHKKWLDGLLKNAFLAPLFIFFLYIIIMFAGFLSRIVEYPDGADPMQKLMSVVIPFVILMMLLSKAKKLAEEYSGEMGKAVISSAKMLGGLAVGGAALGAGVTAFAGRNIMGRVAASASRREGAMSHAKATLEYNKKYAEWEKSGGTKPTKPVAPTSLLDRLGARVNESQLRSGKIGHARHEMDELQKKLGLEGVSISNLSGVEAGKMRETYVKDHRREIEQQIRDGYDATGKELKVKDAAGNEYMGQADFKEKRYADLNATTADAKKQLEEQLNKEFAVILRDAAKTIGEQRFTEFESEAKQGVGIGTRVMSRSTSGTYDVRNIASLASDRREGIGAKAAVGIIAAVATGMRMGMKKMTGVDAGAAKGDFITDMKQIINESLKGIKVDVKLGEGGGHGASHSPAAHAPDDHGGGHH